MSKKMLMNATQHEENRVAIVEDGILTELDIEIAGHEPTKGNIYRAVVVRVESGLQAAFVDYGAERLGFLQIDEINYKAVKPDYQPAEDGRRPKITDLLQRGQELLVQITKEERGTKGAALTTYLSLAGRYMVIMPGSQTRGVSRKAENDDRKELKQAMASFEMAENIGYIVRTAALNQTSEELERDYRYLIRLYESILNLNQKLKAPALLYKESNLIIRSIRDYFTIDMDEVLIDDAQVFKEAQDFFQMVMPDYARLVKLHQERRPIFSRYQIEEQIETLNRNKVSLPSGGSIVIDPTEALVSIDVNSGKMASEQGVEATATKTNLEAAKEIGRQLRLRDLGGLVVIDFIDMRDRKHAREVEQALKQSLKNDKARVSIGRISQFGLLEMSRQRIKATLAEGSYLTCPHCQGSGRLKSPETQAASLLRKIHASAAKGQVQKIDAQLPLEVASYLLNNKREELVEMERDHNLQIHIHGNRDFLADQLEIEITKKEKEKPQQEFVSAASISLPAPAPKENDAAPAEAQKPEEAPADPEKKRRRRRRRKPATQDNDSARAETQEATGDKPADEVQQVAEVPASSTQAKSAEEQAKPKRRSRRKPKAKQEEVAESQQASAPAEAATANEKPTAETEKDEKPKPRPRSRRRQKPVGEITQDAASESTQGAQVVEQEQQETKPKRPRRTNRKPAKSEANPAQTPEQAKGEQVTAQETPKSDEAEPKKAPAKRRPRKPAAKKAAEAKQENNGNESPADVKEDAPKPKRRRAPRKKPAENVDSTPETT